MATEYGRFEMSGRAGSLLGAEASERGRRMRRIVAIVPSLVVAACSSVGAPTDLTQAQSSELTAIGANTPISLLANGGSETSGTSFLGIPQVGGGPYAFFLAAFNADNTSIGYSVSTDHAVSWQTHWATQAGFVWPGIPMSTPGNTFSKYFSDPWASGTGTVNQAVIVAVANGTVPGNLDVGLVTSVDGGNSFTQSALISDAAGTEAHLGVDGPVVATNGAGRVYVWWFDSTSSANHQWLRPVDINAAGVPTPQTALNLTTIMGANTDQATIAVHGNGAVDDIFLVWSNVFEPQSWACGTPAEQGKTEVRSWYLSVSHNSGASFQPKRLIWTDRKFAHCLTDQSNGSNRTRPSVAYDPVSSRLMIGIGGLTTFDSGGHWVGTRSVLLQWPAASGSGFDWWIPVCNPALCPNLQPCLVNGTLPVGETFCEQYGVEVATTVDGASSRAAMAWHDNRDSVAPPVPPIPAPWHSLANWQADMWGASVRPGAPYDFQPQTQSRITPLTGPLPSVPWTQNGDFFANTAWGDYEGMAAAEGWFQAFWSDNRDETMVDQVYTARFGP